MENLVILIGHVGKEPETGTAGTVKYARFSLATSKHWKDAAGNKQERTEWHNIVAWRGTADICEKYVKKGSKVFVKGEIQYSQKEVDGKKQYFTSIVVDSITLLDKIEKNERPLPEPPVESSRISKTDNSTIETVDAEILPLATEPDDLPF